MSSSKCIRELTKRLKFLWNVPIRDTTFHSRNLGLAGGQATSANQSQMQQAPGDDLSLPLVEQANEKGFDQITEADIVMMETQKFETGTASPTRFRWPLVSPPLQPL